MKLYKPTEIIVHCSDSEWGSVEVIDKWHKSRGWLECGYHFVIANGRPTAESVPGEKGLGDGLVQMGRLVSFDGNIQEGAHCKKYNRSAVGICLIGKKTFTDMQIFSLYKLILRLQELNNFLYHRLAEPKVWGHYEIDSRKTCPNIDMDRFRAVLGFRKRFEV